MVPASVQLRSCLSAAGAALLSTPGVPSTPRALPLCRGAAAEVGVGGSIQLSLPGARWGPGAAMSRAFGPSAARYLQRVRRRSFPLQRGGSWLGAGARLAAGDDHGRVRAPRLRALSP